MSSFHVFWVDMDTRSLLYRNIIQFFELFWSICQNIKQWVSVQIIDSLLPMFGDLDWIPDCWHWFSLSLFPSAFQINKPVFCYQKLVLANSSEVDSSTVTIIFCLPLCTLTGSCIWKQSWYFNPCTLIWGVGIPGSALMTEWPPPV